MVVTVLLVFPHHTRKERAELNPRDRPQKLVLPVRPMKSDRRKEMCMPKRVDP